MVKTKLKGRIVGLFLVFAFLVQFAPIQSLAASNVDTGLMKQAELMIESSKEDKKITTDQVANDLKLMQEKYCVISNASIDSINSDGTIVYKIQPLENVINYVDVKTENDGSVFLHFTDGIRENTVQYAPDNSIYVDGNKIEFVSENNSDENTIMRGATYRTFQADVPYGTYSWEYTGGEQYVLSSGELALYQEAGSYVVGALAAVLAARFKATLEESIIIGAGAAFAYNRIASWLISQYPGSSYASFKEIRKARPADRLVYNYQHRIYVYGMKDYQGGQDTLATFYEVVEPT